MEKKLRNSIEEILNPYFKGNIFPRPITISEGEELDLKNSLIQKIFFKTEDQILITGKIFKIIYPISGSRSRKSKEGNRYQIGYYEIKNLKKGFEFEGYTRKSKITEDTILNYKFSIPNSLSL